ncbi:MAG: hypothetical protein AVDCRST_MAG04-89 [uncultured Acetobacteraceae bacterium]|uniref:Uncharacterized protein n=1 Tax=uncultured Acetobacteraceae bacterium TaxID=169975 RepID=A0A6J4H1G9_9PROT|nr:MAG: hypothetical protein AVDCRST_MAG04-89 [uncultured Acetobacteraceae bacterium]
MGAAGSGRPEVCTGCGMADSKGRDADDALDGAGRGRRLPRRRVRRRHRRDGIAARAPVIFEAAGSR